MPVAVKNIIPCKAVENAQTTQYTATLCKAIIDNFTVTNTSAANATFGCNIVAPLGVAGNPNLIIKPRTIIPGETYHCPEMVGKVIEMNYFVSTIASAANALTMSVSGREIT